MANDPIDDAIHAGWVVEATHGPGSPADFSEGSLDGVGGAHLTPMSWRTVQEAKEFLQVGFQTRHRLGLARTPLAGPILKASPGFAAG